MNSGRARACATVVRTVPICTTTRSPFTLTTSPMPPRPGTATPDRLQASAVRRTDDRAGAPHTARLDGAGWFP